jgi:hypothetical protein
MEAGIPTFLPGPFLDEAFLLVSGHLLGDRALSLVLVVPTSMRMRFVSDASISKQRIINVACSTVCLITQRDPAGC